MAAKDYYLILGVTRAESKSGIRAAFRELAKRYHPDHVGSQGTTVFQEIVEAYEVLSDPNRRALYNRGLQHAAGRELAPAETISVGQGPPPEPLVPEPLTLRNFAHLRPSQEALLDRLRRNFSGLGVPKGERLEALTLEVVLSPDEASRGATLRINVPVFSPCPLCDGAGRDWGFPCVSCGNRGMVEAAESVRIRIPPWCRLGRSSRYRCGDWGFIPFICVSVSVLLMRGEATAVRLLTAPLAWYLGSLTPSVYGEITAIGVGEKRVSMALFPLSPNLDPSNAWLSLQQERNRVFEPP